MTATAQCHAAAFLRHAGLVAAVLAVIAGIFGMHVLTGTHAMHATATAGAAPAATTGHAGHEASPGTLTGHRFADQKDSAGATEEQCSESGHCTGMTGVCTPSAKTASMTAPPPGTFVLGISNNSTAAGAATGHWSYLPVTPSPYELSISRT